MTNSSNRIVLIAELLGISLATADALLCTRPPTVSLRSFLRRLADGDTHHPTVSHGVRTRLKAMFKLQEVIARDCLILADSPASFAELRRYLVEMLDGRTRETFAAVFLDAQHRLIASEVLFVGSIDSACVHHRVVLSRALSHHAVSVVVAHNHPSGSLVPSHADIETTRKLANCLNAIDMTLIDHLIVASGRCESLRNLGFV